MYLSDQQLRDISSAIREAADNQIVGRFYEKDSGNARYIDRKGWLTDADKFAEIELTQRLQDIVPGCTVIGEEATGLISDNLTKVEVLRQKQGWVFTLDPVDGTQNFVNHNTGFGVMIGAVCNGVSQHAWIYFPLKDRLMMMATRGKGTVLETSDGPRTIKQWDTPFEKISFGFYAADACYRKDEETLQKLRDAVLPHAKGEYDLVSIADSTREMIQTGTLGIVHPRLIVWDRTPPALIAREAGCVAVALDDLDADLFNYEGDAPMVFLPSRHSLLHMQHILAPFLR